MDKLKLRRVCVERARICLSDPVPQVFLAAAKLHLAAQAHREEKRLEAEILIRQADDPAIAAWTESILGKFNPLVHKFQTLADSPPKLAKSDRPIPRMPNSRVQEEVVARDGYFCRFCGIPLISKAARDIVRSDYPDAVRWGRRNAEQHAAFQAMNLQFDHVLPNNRGGTSDAENIVLTCAPCNYGRMDWTLDESGLLDPRSEARRSPPAGLEGWNGLRDFRPKRNG